MRCITIKGSKYLSELVDISTLKEHKLNIIKAPTGSGKTYFALTAIPQTIEDPEYKIVYLIDTINGREQILANYKTKSFSWKWLYDLEDGSYDGLFFEDDIYFSPNDSIVVMTYAKYGYILMNHPDIAARFKYIICDELPSLIHFSRIKQESPINLHKIALGSIKGAICGTSAVIIALTATPAAVLDTFEEDRCYLVPIDDNELLQYTQDHVSRFTNLEYLLEHIDSSKTGLVYTTHIDSMKKLMAQATKQGISNIGFWSISNEEHPMTEEQLAVRDRVLHDYEIPEEYRILFINAASETSIKIKSPVDYVIVNSERLDTQIQVRGRINHDIEVIYLPHIPDEPIEVPKEFIGVRLNTQRKSELCRILNLKRDNGTVYGWTTVKKVIQKSGYSVIDYRDGNLRCNIIQPSQ